MEKEYLKVTENLHEDEARLIEAIAAGTATSATALPDGFHDRASLIKAAKAWAKIVTRKQIRQILKKS